MGFLKYCFTISIISLAFDLIWRLAVIIILLLLIPIGIVIGGLIKKQQLALILEYLIIKSLNYYLITSLIFTATFFSIYPINKFGGIMLYAITGGLLLGSLIIAGIRGGRDKASEESNSIALKMLKYDVILLISSLLLYTIMFFVPQIGANYLMISIVKIANHVINWVWGLPIIGYVLGIIGILFILSLILTALGLKPEEWEPISYTPSSSKYYPSSMQSGGTSSSPISSRSRGSSS